MAAFFTALLYVLLVICSLFLICLVLIQRGKGGGLAGAFGGMGGSSAFGTKAGDVFTKITIVTASIWIAVAMLLVLLVNQGGRTSAYDLGSERTGSEIPVPGATTGAGKSKDQGTETAPGGASPAPSGSAPSTTKESPASTPSPSSSSGLPSAIDDAPSPASSPKSK